MNEFDFEKYKTSETVLEGDLKLSKSTSWKLNGEILFIERTTKAESSIEVSRETLRVDSYGVMYSMFISSKEIMIDFISYVKIEEVLQLSDEIKSQGPYEIFKHLNVKQVAK